MCVCVCVCVCVFVCVCVCVCVCVYIYSVCECVCTFPLCTPKLLWTWTLTGKIVMNPVLNHCYLVTILLVVCLLHSILTEDD